ncbi:MAG TPA: HAMP domain-containing protein, partial [Pyrinomonadaceae bacterium]|nr:HAMP domain-containing protein [Pyrinomonadaceae bacterium]
MGSTATGKSSREVKQTNGNLKSNGRSKTTSRSKSDYLDPDSLMAVLAAVQKGDFSVRFADKLDGKAGAVYDALNDIIEKNERLTSELNRISEVVGREGQIGARATVPDASGGWASCIDSVNTLITDLAQPTTEVARVIGAVAEGDLSQHFKLEIGNRPLKGEFLRTGKTVNRMVTQLGAFASEVTRVAREV